MRTCIYSNGDQLNVESGNCPDPWMDVEGAPISLVDWSDSIDVTTPAPWMNIGALIVAGVLLMYVMGDTN